ncbi:Gfo/Idh/MocA family oxidoreductase [Nocardia sp. NPDC050175]|uniref:Gfo/Idh/MocA family oxidoreductase n=1 Tax=Nocardia sp. NPDC050175 TaxID=3364317 RepID=UPI00378B4AB2
MRVVVCGTTFGNIYLEAFRTPGFPFELTGIVARGSERSQACAERHGVPLFTDVAEVPDDTDIACVVVRSAAFGGHGTDLVKAFLSRGIHVLQEHPVHHDELAACLALARKHRVVYRLNSFYPHLEPVRHFLDAVNTHFAHQVPLFVDAACAVQVAYPLFDMLGQALGKIRPFELTALPLPAEPAEGGTPFRSVAGVFGGVPLTLRVQNQIDAADPDNGLHLLHRITIGGADGVLTLADTHGPLLWSPRLRVSAAMKDTFDFGGSDDTHLGLATTALIGPVVGPTFRTMLGKLWPDAAAAALNDLRAAILADEDPAIRGQYHLALCQVWQDLTAQLGYPEQLAEAGRPVEVASLR